MYENLRKLDLISLYHAPRNVRITPVMVRNGMEYLELITAGHLFFEGPEGRDTEYGRGTLFWHVPGEYTVCRCRGDDPYSCYVFKFLTEAGKRPCPRITIPRHTQQLIGFAAESFRRYHSGEDENPAFCSMVYSTLVWYALGPQREPGEQYPDSLTRAVALLESGIGRNVHLDEIAEAAGISQSHLFTLFRRCLKKSPHRYLLEMRISRAKQLLAEGKMPIKEIAAECGFDSLEVFYRQFARSEACTPAAYRRRFTPPDLLQQSI